MKCVCVLLLALSAKAFVAPNARARRRSARCWAVRMSISPAAEGELQLGAPPLEAEDDSAAPPRWNFTYASSSTRRHVAEARMRARERRGGGVPLNIVVLGKPASGKGTIAPMLSVAYRLVNVGVGNLLRSQQRAGTALGAACAERMAAGALLPCELVMDVVGDRIAQRDAASNGWLLDGFPRTVEQAQILVARNSAPDAVIVLDRRVTRALFLHACLVGAMPSSHAVFTVGGAISTREWVVRWSNDDVPSSPHRPDALATEFVNGRCTDIATGARDALLTCAAVTHTRRGAGTPPAGTERAGRRRLVADYAAHARSSSLVRGACYHPVFSPPPDDPAVQARLVFRIDDNDAVLKERLADHQREIDDILATFDVASCEVGPSRARAVPRDRGRRTYPNNPRGFVL